MLALNLKATTTKMLEVCHIHIAISDKLGAPVLGGSWSVNAVKQESNITMDTNSPMGTSTNGGTV